MILDAAAPLVDDDGTAPDLPVEEEAAAAVSQDALSAGGGPSGDPSGDPAAGAETSQPDFSMEETDDPELGDVEEGDEKGLHITVQQQATKDYYFQKYKTEWEMLPEFKGGRIS